MHGWTGPLPSYTISAYGYYDYFWYGWRCYNVFTNIKTVYAGKLNQCHCTIAHQGIPLGRNFIPNDQAIQGRHLASGTNVAAYPISVADSFATSCYTGPPGPTNGNTPTPISAQMVYQYCYGGQQATALLAADTLWRNSFDPYGENLYSYATNNFPYWGNLRSNPALDSTVSYRPWIMYEGGLQANAGTYTYDTNPYSGVTLTYKDLQNLFYGYYQSNYAKDILNASGPTNNSLLQCFKANGGTHMSLYAIVSQWAVPNWGPITPNEWGANIGVSSAPMLTAYANYNYNGNP
jgi:hypothetical protein